MIFSLVVNLFRTMKYGSPPPLTIKPCIWKNISSICVLLCWGLLDSSVLEDASNLPKGLDKNDVTRGSSWFIVHHPLPQYLTSIFSRAESGVLVKQTQGILGDYSREKIISGMCNPGSKEEKDLWNQEEEDENKQENQSAPGKGKRGHCFCDSFTHFQMPQPTVQPAPWSLLKGLKLQC